MSTESDIFVALQTITDFTSVTYVVRDAGDDTQPQTLPFCVFETGEKNFEDLQTFCGVDPNVFYQQFDVLIYAESTTQGQALASQTITALSGIGTLTGIAVDFEPDLRCYITTVSFV